MKLSTAFRYSGIVSGSVLLLLGLFADVMGTGLGKGPGHIQLFLIVLGLSIIYLTAFRRSLRDRFSDLSIIVMNTIVLLLILELASTFALHLLSESNYPHEFNRLVASPPDSLTGNLDSRLFITWIYRPFVLYRAVPGISTGMVSTDADGFRVSPGAEAGTLEDSYLVYCFGGSTMWGWGETDDQTIPAHLQTIMSDHLTCPVTVMNLGQPGWLSSQELIQLLQKLWEGERPDLVVFYDGGNDLGGAVSGMVGSHLRRQAVEDQLNNRTPGETIGYNLLWESMKSMNTIAVFTRIAGKTEESGLSQFPSMNQTDVQTVNMDSISNATLECALGNYRIALSLGDSYGFNCLFLWHPLMAASDKPLSEYERLIWEGVIADSTGTAQIRSAWLLASELSAEGTFPGFIDISGTLDECSLQCYIDACHLNGTGNNIIAERIFEEILRQDLPELASCRENTDD